MIKKPESRQEGICCKKTINGEIKYTWDSGDVCSSPYGERVDDDFCHEEENINEDIIIKKGVPDECAKLSVYDKESCSLIMSKINAERIKNGDKVVIDDDGNTDVITNDQINQIADNADKKSKDIKPDTTKADDIKQQIDVIDSSINTIDMQEPDIAGGNNVIDKPQMDKDNEDVTPAPNIVDDDVAPGPEGIVGVIDSSGDGDSGSSGGNNEVSGGSEVTGAVIGSGNKESFLGKLLKGMFGI